uniref:Telomeric repeat binding factor 1 n=1 Tax=Anas platyrhynchos platyrhynchos TaxID=8840 RepID=A0A493T367_ANAPP
MAAEGDCASGDRVALAAATEAVAAGWVLELSCCRLCRHFVEGRAAEFRRWRAVAQAVINGFSEIATHQKKMVYLCQLLIRIANGKKLECNFEEDPRISPLESALSYWTLLEREESKFDKLHEDIRRLIQIQAAMEQVESKGLEAVVLQNITVNASEEEENDWETTQRYVFSILVLRGSLNSLQNVEEVVDSQTSGRRRQPWTLEEDKKLKSGVRKFGVGNWAKILVHGDFNNRTSVMLKDRWRTLSKIK